jgi:pimeloyl-ACP methyl ester carboxylesterase
MFSLVSKETIALDFLQNLPPPEAPRFWDAGDGRRVAWNEYGDPAGRPLFYYHGWPSSRLQARLLHHLARERGFRVLALDRPGMGHSTYQPGRTLKSWPALVAAFADCQGIGRFSQLGVSGGGPYVLACAARMPERLQASAVLCGAVPLWNADRSGLHLAYRIIIPLLHFPKSWFSPWLRAAARHSTGPLDRPPVSWILRMLPVQDRMIMLENPEIRMIFAESFNEGVRQGGRCVMDDGEIYLHDCGITLGEIRHPIRYWHGAHDRHISAAMAQRFICRIAGAVLTIDPDEAHFSLAIHRARDAMDYLHNATDLEP